MTSKFDGLECICDTCAGDGSVCYMVGAFYAEPGADFSKICNRYRRRAVTNYEKLFGTPEMVVQTLATQNFACDVWCTCLRCPFGESVCPENLPRSEDNEQKMLEWLESEVRDGR